MGQIINCIHCNYIGICQIQQICLEIWLETDLAGFPKNGQIPNLPEPELKSSTTLVMLVYSAAILLYVVWTYDSDVSVWFSIKFTSSEQRSHSPQQSSRQQGTHIRDTVRHSSCNSISSINSSKSDKSDNQIKATYNV